MHRRTAHVLMRVCYSFDFFLADNFFQRGAQRENISELKVDWLVARPIVSVEKLGNESLAEEFGKIGFWKESVHLARDVFGQNQNLKRNFQRMRRRTI